MMCRLGNKQPVILVAEREHLLRFQVSQFLRAAGYEVIEVGEVAEAEDVLGAGTPVDLVFCDVHFACGQNDLDALRRLTDHDPRFPVVVTSSCNVAAAVRSLAIEFIPKPYSLFELALCTGLLLRDNSKAIAAPGEKSGILGVSDQNGACQINTLAVTPAKQRVKEIQASRRDRLLEGR